MQRSLFGLLACALFFAAGAAVADQEKPAPAAPPAPIFALHGFVAASVFVQDAETGFSEGQGALFTQNKPAGSNYLLGGDVRQTRLNFSITGPTKVLGGATPKGVAEIDFFGGNSAGAFGTESVLPRLRLAYAELNWGNTSVLVGQAFTLSFGLAQTSVGHIAFPNFGSGLIAWRFPSVFFFQKFGTPTNSLEVALMAARGSWNNGGLSSFGQPSGVSLTPPPNNVSIGEASAIPQFEGRVALSGKVSDLSYYIFGTGHYDRKKISGFGGSNASSNILEGYSGNGGARVIYGPLTVQGGGYYGRAIGNIFGQVIQFADVKSWAAWGQVGLQMNPGFGLWGFVGTDHPDLGDVAAAQVATVPAAIRLPPNARLQNLATTAMLRYVEGNYVVGLEWFHWHTKWTNAGILDGNQYMLTMLYNL